MITEVEMILNCRPLSYISSEDYEEPLTPSHLLCGHRIMSLPDNRSSEAEVSDTDVQPQDVHRRMRHLSNVMNHIWKRWRKKYLLELRNSHRNVTQHSSTRVVSIRVVVIVHGEDQPRGKWRIGRVEAFVTGSEGQVRGAVVRDKTKAGRLTKSRRPVQRLYLLENRFRNEDPETTISPSRAEPDPAVSSVRPEQHSERRRDRPRWVAAIEADLSLIHI